MPSVEDHFVDRPPLVREIYDALLAEARKLGPVAEDPKKTSIHLNRKSAFAGFYARRDHAMVTLKSGRPVESLRIFRSVQASPKRWYLDIKVFSTAEVDGEFVRWLRHSYDISG